VTGIPVAFSLRVPLETYTWTDDSALIGVTEKIKDAKAKEKNSSNHLIRR
jgi:hypothetical protein